MTDELNCLTGESEMNNDKTHFADDATLAYIAELESRAELFSWILRQPAVIAQAYFWNYSSRTERRKAMLTDMKREVTK